MELELTQAMQMLSWLEEERKKDKARLSVLEERIQGLTEEIQKNGRRIHTIDTTVAGTQARLGRFNEIDRILNEYKAEINSVLERRDEERVKSQRDMTRLHAVDIEEVKRNIAELKAELGRFTKIEQDLVSRRSEEKRLGDMAKQVSAQVEALTKQIDESTRGIPYLEEGRRQDNKRIGHLESETVELGKSIEALASKLPLLENALGKVPPRIDAIYPLIKKQDDAIEEIKVSEFRRQQQLKTWQDELIKFRLQMDDYDEAMKRLREFWQLNQKATADLNSFQERLRQQVAELSEVQRLFEDRIKRRLEEEQTAEEKRWLQFQARNDERWSTHQRQHGDQDKRTDTLEVDLEPLHAMIQQLRDRHEHLIQQFIDIATNLREKRSTLPSVSVPPATSPEDGMGIPDPGSNSKRRR